MDMYLSENIVLKNQQSENLEIRANMKYLKGKNSTFYNNI